MHGQPGHGAQVGSGTLPDVVVVSTKVLVRQLRHKQRAQVLNVNQLW